MKGLLSLFCFIFVICAWGHAGEVHPHSARAPDEVKIIKAWIALGQAHLL